MSDAVVVALFTFGGLIVSRVWSSWELRQVRREAKEVAEREAKEIKRRLSTLQKRRNVRHR